MKELPPALEHLSSRFWLPVYPRVLRAHMKVAVGRVRRKFHNSCKQTGWGISKDAIREKVCISGVHRVDSNEICHWVFLFLSLKKISKDIILSEKQ